ncbi:MAG: prepilin-type N-terminal cleavage/methylation domain-containing protein [Candidatus Roizmanbacteria bacterium]
MVSKKLNKNGFSLIEVLVFITILSMFFVVAASVVTVSLKDMKINENKILATQYAEQLAEWLYAQKESNWGGTSYSSDCGTTCSFTENVTKSGDNTNYCFNGSINISSTTWPTSSNSTGNPCSGAFDLPLYDGSTVHRFKREVKFVKKGVDTVVTDVHATVTVQWKDYGNTYTTISDTLYSTRE